MKFTMNCEDRGSHLDFELTSQSDLSNDVKSLSKWRVEMEEKNIHDALVRRGWTPPTTTNKGKT